MPVWTGTLVVDVDQGLFMSSINAFPNGIFATPLYLGVTVGTDLEMTPRRPFSSVAFAFQADDSLTLSGQTATRIDQGPHVVDTANPHNVTASQTGAVSDGDLTAHAGDATAHHTRYSNNEAFAGSCKAPSGFAPGRVVPGT